MKIDKLKKISDKIDAKILKDIKDTKDPILRGAKEMQYDLTEIFSKIWLFQLKWGHQIKIELLPQNKAKQ